jgi:hypothetical protein
MRIQEVVNPYLENTIARPRKGVMPLADLPPSRVGESCEPAAAGPRACR